jgi:DNA-binding transcriptional MerR regulator
MMRNIVLFRSTERRLFMDDVSGLSRYEISKKELLAETGISYGQLYRWKREGLIPEEWFQKRSAFTGQETFFPRERTLERIKAIQSMKDGLSLSEIREQLGRAPEISDLRKVLTASGVSEGFIDDLGLDLAALALAEPSLRAVVVLYDALVKAEVDEEEQRILIAQVITALSTEALATPVATQEEG